MILKLRNNNIIIEDNSIPVDVRKAKIIYDYELGTNHYKTILKINDKVYEGPNPIADLDLKSDTLLLKVELLDTHNRLMRTYTGTYKYIKLCLIGNTKLIDTYEQLKVLQEENTKLKEQGEVI